jgi:tRNA modification GTPase
MTDDPVEQEGIRMAVERIPVADLVLVVFDGSRPFDQDDEQVVAAVGAAPVIVVVNKSDMPELLQLPAPLAVHPRISISTRTGAGMDCLRGAVSQFFLGVEGAGRQSLLSQVRHREAVERASASLERFRSGFMSEAHHELLALDLRDALDALGQVVGETTPDDILDLIFSRFCIGK